MAPLQRLSAPRRRRILLALVLFPLAILAAAEIAGWPFLRSSTEDLLHRQLERTVRIDAPFRVRFLGGIRLQAAGLWIGAPAELDAPHFLDGRDIVLRLRYSDLREFQRSGSLRVAALDVGRMDARLIRNAAGDATWHFGPSDPKKEPPRLPTVGLLGVGQGHLVFRDPGLDADLTASFDTREGVAQAAPVSHMEARGRLRKYPLTAQLTAHGWLPAAPQASDAPPMATKGWLTYGGVRADFDGVVKDLFGRRGIKGNLTIRGPSLGLLGRLIGSPLPTTTGFVIQARIDKELDVWRVDVERARIGSSDLAARFTFDPEPKPPRVEGELAGTKLVLADLAPTFGTRSEEGRPLPRRPGRTLPSRPLDLPSLKNLDAHVTVHLEQVDLGAAFKEPIRPFKAVLTLEQGKLGLAKVDARTAKGRLSGDISLDARQEPPLWRSDLAWEGIRLENWLRSAKVRGKELPGRAGPDPPAYFTGILQGRSKLAGTGRSTAELLGSLDGDITMFVRDGTLSHLLVEVLGLDVAQGLGLLLRGDESLPVRCAVMDLRAKDGRLTPKVALIDTPVTLVLASGSINLGRESLDLRLTAKPKNISPLTVRSPIRVQGSFANPDAAPEPGPIAARVLGGVALAFVNPLAAIIPFLDPGAAEGSPCAEALAALKG